MTVGSVVKSIAGHDKNRFFMVLRIEGDFAYIADGKARALSSPKKKRLKHLRKTNAVIDPGTVLTDKQLRAALRSFTEQAHDMLYEEGSEPIG
jgi:ribosomal protein L14E/L6E/L27E